MHLKNMVSDIPYPYAHEYFESASADGFAFLGYAQYALGLDATYCRDAINERNYTLNAEQRIKATDITVPNTSMYVYTIWPCVEFLHLRGEYAKFQELVHLVEEIGAYQNGMIRYCTHEIDYIVPNVTSACALLYALTGRTDKAASLIDLLRSRQLDGNWRYEIFSSGKLCGMEDSYHLAMMVYHLRQVQITTQIMTSDIIDKALPQLQKLNNEYLQPGSIGWGIPMLYISSLGLDDGLSQSALKAMMGTRGLWHKNFRVRAITAWALVKGYELLQKEKET
ncbi:MAG: hypothetical protein JXM72_08395 [Deltaproteobacteria bacterium]|nr:hypothetical protein [Deltaproteobacteria bacterium]